MCLSIILSFIEGFTSDYSTLTFSQSPLFSNINKIFVPYVIFQAWSSCGNIEKIFVPHSEAEKIASLQKSSTCCTAHTAKLGRLPSMFRLLRLLMSVNTLASSEIQHVRETILIVSPDVLHPYSYLESIYSIKCHLL